MTHREQYARCLTAELSLEAAVKSLHVARNMAMNGTGVRIDAGLRDRLQAILDGVLTELKYVQNARDLHAKRLEPVEGAGTATTADRKDW